MRKVVSTLAFIFLAAAMGSAQSPASNKAFFAKSTTDMALAPVGMSGDSAEVTVFDITDALKTSNGGAVSATLSMEAALWTYNLTTAIVNGGKASSSSRAAIKAWVEIDGVAMEPGLVVYADRLQATGLQVDLSCVESGGGICTVTGTIALELFQRTKNAAAFTFFAGPLAPVLHSVKVKAQGFIECRNNGVAIACPATTLDGYADAGTQAVIGKATLLLEEHQNWGKQ